MCFSARISLGVVFKTHTPSSAFHQPSNIYSLTSASRESTCISPSHNYTTKLDTRAQCVIFSYYSSRTVLLVLCGDSTLTPTCFFLRLLRSAKVEKHRTQSTPTENGGGVSAVSKIDVMKEYKPPDTFSFPPDNTHETHANISRPNIIPLIKVEEQHYSTRCIPITTHRRVFTTRSTLPRIMHTEYEDQCLISSPRGYSQSVFHTRRIQTPRHRQDCSSPLKA